MAGGGGAASDVKRHWMTRISGERRECGSLRETDEGHVDGRWAVRNGEVAACERVTGGVLLVEESVWFV